MFISEQYSLNDISADFYRAMPAHLPWDLRELFDWAKMFSGL